MRRRARDPRRPGGDGSGRAAGRRRGRSEGAAARRVPRRARRCRRRSARGDASVRVARAALRGRRRHGARGARAEQAGARSGFATSAPARRGRATAAGLLVTGIGPDRNRGQRGWVYKVGRRAATAGAGDLGGPFGRGRLRAGQRVTWFYCVRAGDCQRTLEVRATPGEPAASSRPCAATTTPATACRSRARASAPAASPA